MQKKVTWCKHNVISMGSSADSLSTLLQIYIEIKLMLHQRCIVTFSEWQYIHINKFWVLFICNVSNGFDSLLKLTFFSEEVKQTNKIIMTTVYDKIQDSRYDMTRQIIKANDLFFFVLLILNLCTNVAAFYLHTSYM